MIWTPEYDQYFNHLFNQEHMKKILFVPFALALFWALGACNQQPKKQTSMNEAINPAYMNKNILPGNNFYNYVNGTWIKDHPVPPEYSSYGSFTVLYENNQKELKDLIDEISKKKDAPKGSIDQKIRDLFNSGMDTAQINAAGIKPIESELKTIQNIKNKKQLDIEVAKLHTVGVHPVFFFYAGADEKNSSMEIANLHQGGLGMPDVDYYLKDDAPIKKIRAAYVQYIAKMFELKGDSEKEAMASAKKVLDVETQLAKVSFTRLERRSPENNYNKMSLAELEKISPDFGWATYFDNLGLKNPGDINVSQLRFFKGISTLMKKIPLNQWKTYLQWSVMNDAAPYLSEPFVQAQFDFYGKTLSGQQEMRPRWKRVLGATSGSMGEALGKLYVAKYFW